MNSNDRLTPYIPDHKEPRKDKLIIAALFLFALIACFFNTKNSPFYFFNDWCDPHIYFSIGKGMFNGEVPYRDLFDHKGPLIYFIYGVGYLISNASFLGVYIIESCFWFISLLYAYKLARLFLDKPYSFVIALLYSTLLFSKSGMGGSADEFIVPAITISFYYFISYFKYDDPYDTKRLYKLMLIQGITFGFSFLTKYSVNLFWLPLLLAIAYQLYTQKRYREILFSVLYFSAGSITLCVPFLIYFAVNGATNDFFYAYFKFNSIYASTGFTIDNALNIVVRFLKCMKMFYIAFPLTFFGLGVLLFSKRYIKRMPYKIGIFFSFFLLYLPIANSRDHHLYGYIVIYIFALIGLIFLFNFIGKHIKASKRYINIIYPAAFVLVLLLNTYNQELFAKEPHRSFRKTNYIAPQQAFANIINEENNPTLLDLGLDKGIYTASNVVPTYKYFFHPAIREEVFPQIREYQKDLVKRKEPSFVVTSLIEFPYLEENYTLVSSYIELQHPYSRIYLYKKK